ncbi:MAG: DUF3322 domain-containing protein [Polyangia bacterium]
MAWTTPDDVRAQVQRLWDRGRILAARLGAEPLFPLALRLERPQVRELSDRFAEAREWIRVLDEGSKKSTGQGYEIVYAEINHRQLGMNRVPQALLVPSEADALALIGKRRQSDIFARLVENSKTAHPELLPWIARRPLDLLDHADDWARILTVLSWFRDHPRPGIYARQIDVEGVHTKFIETHRRLLAELLDLVLPAEHIDQQAIGAQAFERRLGLLCKPALVRFRVLDQRLRIQGLDDVSTPLAQFARLNLPARRVFITENEINGLAFPEAQASIIIFGLGYGVERLGLVPWLQDKAIYYWGDLDTHGFAILDSLRAVFPKARSFLMDRQTLLGHRPLWVEEPEPSQAPLSRLTEDEYELFEDLRFDRLGHRVRLEQERIAFGHVARTVASLLS